MNVEKVALFDMDGTLCNYDGQLFLDMIKIKSPNEVIKRDMDFWNKWVPKYLERRRHMITNQPGWWLSLKKFQLGWDVLKMCDTIGFQSYVLTKGPLSKPQAWSEKVQWCQQHIHPPYGRMHGIHIVSDKGLVYGRVLVDDYPEYIERWLEHRPRGLVVMPAHHYNQNFKHKNVIRYDGKNTKEVEAALQKAFDR